MENIFYSQGLRFSCKECSHCCRHEAGFVYLSKTDLTKLCEWFKLKEAVFIKMYCRFVPYYDGREVLSLKEKPNYDCILWDMGCTAYKARPVQCATYPFWPHILKNRLNWDTEALECPGINTGILLNKTEIHTVLDTYIANVPLNAAEC